MKYSTLMIIPAIGLAMSSAAVAGSYGKDMSQHDKQQYKMEHRADTAPNAIIRSAMEDRGLFVPETRNITSVPVAMTDNQRSDSVNSIVDGARADRGTFVPSVQSEDFKVEMVEMNDRDYGAPNRIIQDANEDRGQFFPDMRGNS